MKSIYWNTKDIKDLDRVLDLLAKESPEIMFLAETDENVIVAQESQLTKINYQFFPNPGCERVKIIKRFDFDIELSLQSRYYSAVFIKDLKIYLISVHLPSLLFQHMDSLKEFIREFRTSVDAEIGSSLDTNILFIGDFNVNPFEKPMIDFDGFLATNSVKAKGEITHLGKRKASYYNPTWQLYSRKNFPGTKYYKRPSGASYDILEFHYLDQVLVSQYLKNQIIDERIEVIEKSDNYTFFNIADNSVEGSDHLPILYEFKIA